ncbi:cell wall metabolism sensor histidine kinase WalK [Alkaliphilus pronyensis]|uniref:histidine kinase n=2 Tax=Alkaliphilus pronyensis TaxID=1482732 RepID=A0A6I0FL54_9FIRM|nr:cell wall metabolism sensor histidine kinase WalK [Alkaliphilus pronyensis]
MIINVFVYETIKKNYLDEKEMNYLTQANILSNRVRLSVDESTIEFNQLYLNQMMDEIGHLVEGRILIIDRNNNAIYDSFNDIRDTKISSEEISRALKGERVVSLYKLDRYGETMYISVPVIYYDRILGVVFMSISLQEAYNTINSVKNLLFFISLLTLLLITGISLVFANLISQPIKVLTEAMQRTAQGKLNERVDIDGNDEIGQLSRAYNFMSTKLSHIEKQRKDFVANVSHELKTPLSSMKLLAESLIMQPSNNISIYHEFLEDIDSEIDRLNEIIESLLSMVDLDEEKLNLNYKLTYVNYLIEKVVNNIRPLAEKKNIKIIISQWEKIQIFIDQGKIYQALMNIIYNAVKYTDDGGKITINIEKEGRYAVIKVTDTGYGIPKESLPYIFDRFYRVDSARSRKTGGTGLGLSISHQIISLHQGTIEVESEVKKGSTFIVRLPMDVNKH